MNDCDIEFIKKSLPERMADSHKGIYGKALIIAGSPGMAGAAFLSAYAAYTVGCGLVKVFTHKSNRCILQQLLPEAMVTTYDGFDTGHLQEELNWADTIAIGPGMGMGMAAKGMVNQTMEHVNKMMVPCVVDADGINILSDQHSWQDNLYDTTVITPHPKEFSRLSGYEMNEILENPKKCLHQFMSDKRYTCVLKMHETLVIDSSGREYKNHTGNAGMAKGGSGDVLTGVVAGFMAQGVNPWEASTMGVCLHGLGGDTARQKKGIYSMLARDTIEGIGEVLRQIDQETGEKDEDLQ